MADIESTIEALVRKFRKELSQNPSLIQELMQRVRSDLEDFDYKEKDQNKELEENPQILSHLAELWRDSSKVLKTPSSNIPFLANILDSLPSIVVIYDLSSNKLVYANQSFIELFGYSLPEVIGQDADKIAHRIHQDDLKEYAEDFEKFLYQANQKGKDTLNINEYRVLDSKQEWVWMRTYTLPYLFNKKGEVIQTLNISQNISTLKKAQEELDYFFSVSADIFCMLGENYEILKINKAWSDTLQYSTNESLGKSLEGFIYHEDLLVFKEIFKNIKEGLSINRFISLRFQGKDAAIYWLSWTIQYIKSDQLFICSARDVSEKRQIERDLRNSEKKYRYVVEQSPFGIAIHSKGILRFMNQSARKIIGIPKNQEVEGKDIAQFVHPESLDEVFTRIQALKAGESIKPAYEKFVKVDGSSIMVETIGALIQYGGEPSVQVIFQDVSERYESQLKIETLNRELVEKNSALLAQEEELASANEELLTQQGELKKTLKELSERNYELDQLVYKMSHDLRSPLSTILGLVNIINIESSELKKQEYLDLIENRVNRLDRFIRTTLNYAKANRSEIKTEIIDFEALVQSCIEDLEYLEHADKIQVSLDIQSYKDTYYGDPLRIQIIFNNIITNAFKYVNPHQNQSFLNIKINIEEDFVQINFRDNGIGIGKEHIDKIFKIFYRASTQSEGSGLGMYIVRQTVDKLKGKIKLNSKLGEGTEIDIRLPSLNS